MFGKSYAEVLNNVHKKGEDCLRLPPALFALYMRFDLLDLLRAVFLARGPADVSLLNLLFSAARSETTFLSPPAS